MGSSAICCGPKAWRRRPTAAMAAVARQRPWRRSACRPSLMHRRGAGLGAVSWTAPLRHECPHRVDLDQGSEWRGTRSAERHRTLHAIDTSRQDRERDMSKDAKPAQKRIDQFLYGPGGRADDWRDLVEAAKAWARGGDRAKYDAALADLVGDGRISRLSRPAVDGGAEGSASRRRRTRSRLRHGSRNALTTSRSASTPATWSAKDDGNGDAPIWCRRRSAAAEMRRPYFETLIVTGAARPAIGRGSRPNGASCASARCVRL